MFTRIFDESREGQIAGDLTCGSIFIRHCREDGEAMVTLLTGSVIVASFISLGLRYESSSHFP